MVSTIQVLHIVVNFIEASMRSQDDIGLPSSWDEQDLRRVRGTIKEGSLGALKAEIKKRAGSQTLMTA